MKILYRTDDVVTISNYINNIIGQTYNDNIDYPINISNLDKRVFKFINYIILIPKRINSFLLDSIFSYNDIDKNDIKIVETQYNYYLSCSLYTLSSIMYNTIETPLSEDLKVLFDRQIPNIFDNNHLSNFLKKFIYNKRMYVFKNVEFFDNISIFSYNYIRLLETCTDLVKDQLDHLMRINMKINLSYNELSTLIMNNKFKYSSVYELCKINTSKTYPLMHTDIVTYNKNITNILKNISINDKYSNSNIRVEFDTDYKTICEFLFKVYKSNKHVYSDIDNILPLSTMTDLLLNISITDLHNLAIDNKLMRSVEQELVIRNNYMMYALLNIPYEQNLNGRVTNG